MYRRQLMKHGAVIACLVLVIFVLCVPANAKAAKHQFRNVIILVGDGMGSAHTTLARWYKGGPLSLDRMYVGAIRTYAADSLITDSAPAATAFACGHRTCDKLIGVMPGSSTIPGVPQPGHLAYKPVASVLEGAKLSGRSVGIVATSNVQHATPAAFSSHWPDRSNFNEIAKQQVYQNIDVVFGGGRQYLLPKGKGGTRTDNEDLFEVLRSRGYAVVRNREDMFKNTSRKVWGLFADDDMAYDFDRKHVAPGEPGLAEMTSKAINLLSENKKGFFLFVEGSKIDWASHANDPIGVISDVLAFEEAVGAALDFAGKDRNTLVIAFSDHGNGGMSIGNKRSDKIYSQLQYEALVAPFRKASLTGEGIEKILGRDLSADNIKNVVAKYFGISDLTSEEITAISEAKNTRMNGVLGPVISRRSYVGWTTKGHTGEDIFFYYYGTDRPVGTIENKDIARMMADAMGFKLDVTDSRLLASANEVFDGTGASINIDKGDPENKVLVIEAAGKRAELPFSKNIIRVRTKDGLKQHEMEGVTVFSPKTGKVYLPRQAVSIFMKEVIKEGKKNKKALEKN